MTNVFLFFWKVIMLRKFKFMVPFCRCMNTFMVLNISLEIQYGVFFTKQNRKYVYSGFTSFQKKNLQFYFWEPNNSIYENEKKNVLWSQNPKKATIFFESIAKISTSRTVGWLESKKVQIEKVVKPKWNKNQNTFFSVIWIHLIMLLIHAHYLFELLFPFLVHCVIDLHYTQ